MVNILRIPSRLRVSFIPGVAAACSAVLVSGCMSSPTYGTGKTANAQLLEDLTSIVSTDSFTGQGSRAEIAYTPRGELVRPASMEILPEPQQDIASAENPAWPESPEQRRARLRAEATENRDNPNYRPAIRQGGAETDRSHIAGGHSRGGVPEELNEAQQRVAFQQRLRESRQGDANNRRYLSEPPTEYRVPSATAPAGDFGEDEWRKQRRVERAAGKSSWRDYIPGF